MIELLVVVTIIVVLLALLTPALDKAIYQAELAACAANMHGIGQAVTLYASEHKRYYPQRDLGDSRAMSLSGLGLDTRPRLKPYLSLKMLVDPLCAPVDLSIEANDPNTVFTYSSDWLWFGWKIDPTKGGIFKQGDRMEWADAGKGYEFDFLVSDGQAVYETDSISQNSHPDRLDRSRIDRNLQVAGLIGVLTYSLWYQPDISQGSELDCNYTHGDLSVNRLNGLIYDGATRTMDGRLVKFPERNNGQETARSNYLPQP